MQSSTRARTLSLVLGFIGLLVVDTAAQAAITTYVWSTTTNNVNWGIPGDWVPNGPADGAGNIADFSTLNITIDTTVNLDSNRTIGQLIFADTTASNNWILAGAGGTLTLDNTGGTGQPLINVKNQTTTISAVLAGTNGVRITGGNGGTSAQLNLSGTNTYSGVTTINSAATGATAELNLLVQNNSAFGTSSINYNPGTGNEARILLDAGVNIANNITLQSVRPAQGQGAIQTNGDVTATWSGAITKTGASNQGADFGGPNVANTTNYLILTGPIISNLASQAKGSSNNGFQIRLGNVRMADTTGTSSASVINPRDGILQVGATNGIATNSYVDIGGNVNNPAGVGRASLDLNGFNQSLVGVANYVSMTQGNTQAANEFITNSSTTSAATLTLRPVDASLSGRDPNQANLVYTAYPNGIDTTTAFISDASAAFPLSIVVNGDANGVQYLATPNGSQRGSVTLTSGILAVSALANGGSNSSIGASSNAATNLVFGGGTLRYTNTALNATNATVNLSNSTTPSTDRNFTINNGSTGTIEVTAAGTTLTWSGGSANTTGTLNKTGAGTLVLSGANSHTGGTNVNAGTLSLTGSLSSGTVTVANTATLKGTGTIGGTLSVANGGTLAPGLSVGTLTVGGLTLNTGSITNFEFNGTPANDQITITGAGGLTMNGGNLNLFQEGTLTAFSANGTYTLMNYNGGFTGALANLTISNPSAGKFYNLTSTASAVQLTIGDATTTEWNNNSSDGLWTTAGNWTGGVPNAIGTTAKFANLTGGGSVNMNGNKTVSGLIFDNGSGYTITGSGTLTLNNGGAASAVSVNNGTHTIAVPISLTKATSIAFLNNSTLNISGAISGAQPVNLSGPGTLNLTANNAYSTTVLSASTLNVGTFGGSDTAGSLGTGDLTMSNAATLNFNRSNAYAFAGGIAGSGVGAGTVNQLGSGTTTVSGAIGNVTSVNVSAGTLVASSTISQNSGITLSGTGSLTANGSVSGTGGLTMGSSGTVNLNAANSYSPGNNTTAGTTVNSGTVNLNAAGALPTNTSLAVNGGTLNLNGNNISLINVLDSNASTGVITNNGPANSTSTITFSAPAANYDFYAALNDGVNGGKVAVVSSINNTAGGPPIFTVHFHTPSTFSGGITVNAQSIQADANNAFGTGPISIPVNNGSTNSSQIFLAPGVTIGNSSITIAQGHPVPNNGVANGLSAVIAQTAIGGSSTVSGTVTIQANNLNGGLFQGPAVGAVDFLNINGAVNTAGTADTIVQTGGNVKYSGGGSYPNFMINGVAALGATNGLAQNALLQFSIEPSASPAVAALAGTLDLNGFDQTAVALSSNSNQVTLPSVVQNSGVTPNTLTLNTSGTNSFNGSINDGALGGTTNLTVAGSGTQVLTGSSSSYTGVTTFSGTSIVQASNIGPSGSASSIGAASSDPSRLVFDGGTLQYTGATSTSTDHGFTINTGKTAHMGVNTAGVNLTLTGAIPTSSGNFEKTGAGNLTFDAVATIGYTGSTTVSGGRLFVNNQLTGTSSMSVSAGATLAGSGTIGSPTSTFSHAAGTINPGAVGGVSAGTLTIGGSLTLAGGGVSYDVDDSNLNNQAVQDLVKINGAFNVTTATPIELDFLNPGASPTAFSYKLFQFGSTTTTLGTLQSSLVFSTNLTAGRLTATPTFSGNTVVINVNVAPAAVLTWNSTSSGAWDTSTANWFNAGTSAADKFVNGDQVTFADTTHGGSTPQNAINISGTLSPSAFNITSNAVNYTFSSSTGGSIAGNGSLNILGSSTTTIKTNNTYSGGTTITSSSATVDVGGGGTSGTLGTGDVSNNGTLKFTRTDGNAVTPVHFVNNINGTGNLTNSCPGTTVMDGNISQNSVTLNGNGTATLKGSVSTSSTTAGIAVSGATTAVDFQGTLNTNVANGAGLSVSGSAVVNVDAGLNGSGGVNLSGGSLTMAGGSGYNGNTIISGGTFFPSDANAFGNTTGTTTVSGTGSIYASNNVALDYGGEAISISGTGTNNNGAMHAGGGVTHTFGGTVTLAGDSLINLDAGSTLALSGSDNGTALTGNHVLTLAGTGTLSIGGTTVNVTSINTGTTGSALAFAPASLGTLTVSSPISGAATSTMNFNTTNAAQGALGTTILTANNSAFLGNLSIGSGNLQVTAANQLGSGTGTITMTGGAAPAINGTLLTNSGATMSVSNPISFSARQGVNVNVPHIENVSGNTTFTGAVTMTSGGTDYTLQSDSGTLTIQGNINTQPIGPANFNIRRLNLQGSGNGALNGTLTDAQDTTPGNDATGNPIFITKSGSGTWTLGASSAVHGDLTINDSGTLVIAAGKSVSFTDNPGGHGNLSLNNPATGAIPGATPHISFGSTGSDTGSNLTTTSAAWGAADTVLKIGNWTYGAGANGDHFIIATDPGASVRETQIQFADFTLGAAYTTVATAARAVGEITPLIGDINQDGVLNGADLSALLSGLTDIATFQSARALTSPSHVFTLSDANFLLDVNGDGNPNNADIQAEIHGLISGSFAPSPGPTPTSAVPEPASCLLIAFGGALLLARKRSKLLKRQSFVVGF